VLPSSLLDPLLTKERPHALTGGNTAPGSISAAIHGGRQYRERETRVPDHQTHRCRTRV